jgi:hypothetical protein
MVFSAQSSQQCLTIVGLLAAIFFFTSFIKKVLEKMWGFIERTYQITKKFPNRILDKKDRTLTEYF